MQPVSDQFSHFPIAGCLGCVCDMEIGDSPPQFNNALGNWQVYKTPYWGRHNANWWTGNLPTFGRVSLENYIIGIGIRSFQKKFKLFLQPGRVA